MLGDADQTVEEFARIEDCWLKSRRFMRRVRGLMAVYGSEPNYLIAGIPVGGIGWLV